MMRLPILQKIHFSPRNPFIVMIVVALLSLLGMALTSPVIESITFREVGEGASASAEDIPMSAPYVHVGNTHQMATIHFWYRGYGNSKLILSPRYCFYGGITANGRFLTFPNNNDNWCQPLTLDLRSDFSVGENTLSIEVGPHHVTPEHYSPHVGFTLGTRLFGGEFIQSVCSGVFVLSLLILVWLGLERERFSVVARIMFMLACMLLFDCLHTIGQYGYSLDLEKHIPYLQYMAEHPLNAHGYTGPEGWHPAGYYQITAWIVQLCQWTGVFDPWTGLRFFSLLCYATFLYFGMKTLRRIMHGLPFYLSLALLLYWPSGLLSAAWFFNDVLLYPLYGAAFYYTLLWYEEDRALALIKAMILCGAAFMVKLSALVPLCIIGMCVLAKLLRKELPFTSLLRKPLLYGEGLLGLGILSNYSGYLYDKITGHPTPPHLGGDGGFYPNLSQFLFLDLRELVATPFFNSWEIPDFWVVTIKTLLFTNSYWSQTLLGSLLMVLLFVMGAYSTCFLFTLDRRRILTMFPVVVGSIIPFMGLIGFTMMAHNSACRDFRYVQPGLVAIVALYVLSVQEAKRKDYLFLYYVGTAVAALFPMYAITMYILQMHPV